MQDFRKLKVWQKAHELTLEVYRVTARFPREELFGLTSQLRRACASVPLNLAEGSGYAIDRARAHATQIAIASSCEVEYAFLLAHDLEYITASQYDSLREAIVEIRKMLMSLASHFRAEREPCS